MKLLLSLFAPMIFMAQQSIAPPLLSHRPDNTKAPFEVTYQKGAVWACTVYRSETETIEELRGNKKVVVPYTPRHCWGLEDGAISYTDDWAWIKPNGGDWTVWAEVYYLPDTPAPDPIKVETNRLRVTW